MAASEDEVVASIAKEASRIEEDALYSSKGHFEAASVWSKLHLAIGLPAAAVSAIAGISAFNNLPTLAAILAAGVAALAAILTFLNPSDRAHLYHVAGTRFSAIRGEARRLREIELPSTHSVDHLSKQVGVLAKAKDDLNAGSPQIPRWAFERARKAIENGEASYSSDETQ